MLEQTLQQRMTAVRSMCEEYFYTVSAFMDDQDAAVKLAQVLAKQHMTKEIALHEEFIKLCDKGTTYTSYFSKKYDNGISAANEARKKTHLDYISDLKKNIEILNANIL